MTEFRVMAEKGGLTGWLTGPGLRVPVVLGRGGVKPEADKRENDGATPLGAYPLRRVLLRTDRIAALETGLPVAPIGVDDGWCDDPTHSQYNQPVKRPFKGRHERLWRKDNVYDVVVVIGHNDTPVVSGMGSAIFMHLQRPDASPTQGCVAMPLADMQAFLAVADIGDRLVISQDTSPFMNLL